VPSIHNDNFISWVNQNKEILGWQADPCKLQKNHPDYLVKCSKEKKKDVTAKEPENLVDRSVGSLYRDEKEDDPPKFADGSDAFKKALKTA